MTEAPGHTAGEARTLAARLDAAIEASQRLADRDPRATARSLAVAAQHWLANASLRAELPRMARLSPAMIDAVLPLAAAGLDENAMTHLAKQERTGKRGRARLVAHVLASNVPALALPAIALGCLAGVATLVKSGRADRLSAPAFHDALEGVDPALAATVVTTYWPGGTDDLERVVVDRAAVLVASGHDETMAALGTRAGNRLLPHGERISVAVVGVDATEGPHAAEVARRIATDVALYEQRGCLSPHAVYVQGDADAFAARLADALSAVAAELPAAPASVEERAAIRTFVTSAEWDGARVITGTGGTVLRDDTASLRPTCGRRTVRVTHIDDPATLATRLPPGLVECVGVADAALRPEELRPARCLAHLSGRADAAAGPLLAPGTACPTRLAAGRARQRIPGGRSVSDRLTDLFTRHVCQTSDAPMGLVVDRARGSTVWDTAGRAHLDLLAGMGVANVGHAHPEVVAAVRAQAERHLHVMVYGEFVQETQVRLAARLAEILPPDLSVTYFTNSGAEAIEGAMKTARKHTGRPRFVAFEGGFHGDTWGAVSVGGNPVYRTPFEPLLPEVTLIPPNDVAALGSIDTRTAAVLLEPVQAEAGVRVCDGDFLRALRDRCRETGALLVFDEVVTGLGRTGRRFAFEHWGVVPDILVLAKALGGGLPLGAFIGVPEVMRTLSHDPPLAHVTTFGGHPLSTAAGLAALEVLLRDGLVDRAATLGAALRERLAALVGRGDLVEVRGLGMLLGLEFATAAACAAFTTRACDAGLILNWTLHRDTVVRLAPPLVLTNGEADDAVARIARALDDRTT